MEAHCQCGKSNISIPFNKPLMIAVCHCTKCRLITGSAFNIAAVFPYFDIPASVSSNLGVSPQGSDSGNKYLGHFCKSCGSRMFHSDGSEFTDEERAQGMGKSWISFLAPRVPQIDMKQILEDGGKAAGLPVTHCWTKEAIMPPSFWEGVVSFETQPPTSKVKDTEQWSKPEV